MSYADAILADGPVSWWRLDESSGTNAADQMGVNAGTYMGGFTLNQGGALTGSGDADASVLLNGSTGFVSVPYAAGLNTSVFTWEIWAKPAVLAGARYTLLSTSGGTAGVNESGLSLWINPSNLVNLEVSQGTSDTSLFTPVGTLSVGNWFHVALAWNSITGAYQLWLNGVSITSGTQTIAGYVPNTSAILAIGEGSSFFFNGNLTQAAVYNYALSTAQVAAHYNAGVGLPRQLGAPIRMPLGA